MILSSPSNLHDDILCKILSCLPTKLAFSATILSKRWTTSLYRLHTDLYFDHQWDPDLEAFLRFCCFVNTVTLSTKLIKSFNLTCHSQHIRNDRSTLDSWIETVKRHPVEIIQISSSFSLPPSFFKFPTLVILKLRFVVVSDISVNLPSLKTLHLYLVSFINENNLQNLLHGCPVLEHLEAYIQYRKGCEDVTTGEFKSLSKLITADVNTYAGENKSISKLIKAISNVKILTLQMRKRPPKINSYSVFQNLIKLHLKCYDNNFRLWDDIVELLQYFPKLQILSLEMVGPAKKELSINMKYPASSVPECISSHLRSCTIYYGGREDELEFIKYILQNACRLEVMKIKFNDYLKPKPSRGPLEELSSCPMISPQCKLSIPPCRKGS